MEVVKKSDKVLILSAWQLAQLDLRYATQRWIEVVLLASSENDPAVRLINPRTWEPFVKEENVIVVPKTEDWKPKWFDEASLEKLMEHAWDRTIPITTEWENIPAEVAEYLEKNWFTVYPNSQILRTIQDRLTEKQAIEQKWLETVPYSIIKNETDIHNFITWHWWFGKPWYVLKTRKNWYDWHWQARIACEKDVSDTFDKLRWGKWWLIIEKMIDLDFEASVIIAKDRHWSVKFLPPIYNIHNWWILNQSIVPAPIDPNIEKELTSQAVKLMSRWESYVWILTVEFFVDNNWKIYVNELAPRTHNSGHATLNYGWTSQNDLWMDAVSWRTLQVIDWTRAIVMQNILTQADLAYQTLLYNAIESKLWDWFTIWEIWDIFWVNLNWINEWNLYDYLKAWGKISPNLNRWKERKMWHVNMELTDEMSALIGEIRAWCKSREELLYQVSKLWTVRRI